MKEKKSDSVPTNLFCDNSLRYMPYMCNVWTNKRYGLLVCREKFLKNYLEIVPSAFD